jgi:hypothetical protein
LGIWMLWWSSRSLTKLKSQSQKCFKEQKYQYLKYKNKNHSGTYGHVKIIGYQFGAKFKLVGIFCFIRNKCLKVFYLNSQRNKNLSGSFQPDQEKACNVCPFQRFQYFPKA